MSNSRKSFVGASTMALVVVALVAAAAACVLVAVMASAGAKRAEALPKPLNAVSNPLTYPSASSPSNLLPGNIYRAVAKCPVDHQVISGGFELRVADTPWRILDSRPITTQEAGSPNAWVVQAFLPHNTRSRVPFWVDAVCVPESLVPHGSIDYSDRNVEVPAGETRELTPDCRPFQQAIGGGFRLDNTTLYLIRSQPNPGNGFGSWIVAVGKKPQGRAGFAAWSVCVRKDLVKNLDHKDQPDSSGGVSGILTATARCPQGTYPLSGGGGTSNDNAKKILWSTLRPQWNLPSQQDPIGWNAAAKDDRTIRISNITIHAHSMCGRLGDGLRGGRFE